MLRRRIRHHPVVDDQGSRRRAELDDASVADEIIVRRQVDVGVDQPAIDHEREAELRADAADQRFRGLLADIQCQHGIAVFGVAVDPCPRIGQAADRTDLRLAGVEEIADLAGGNEARAVGGRGDGVDHAGPAVAIVLPAEGGEALGEEMRVGPCAIGAELIGVGFGGAGIVEEPRLRIGVIEGPADEGVVVDDDTRPRWCRRRCRG